MAKEHQTECPHCTAILAVDDTLLRAKDPRVRCGHCLAVFNARECLITDATVYDGLDEPTPELAEHEQLPPGLTKKQITPAIAPATADIEEPPPEVERKWWESLKQLLPAIFGTLLISLILLVSSAIMFRDALGQSALRPIAVAGCWIAGCQVGPRWDIDSYQLLRSRMYSHPDRANVLVISAQFVNEASFAQPLPQLTLILRDTQGNEIARGEFEPKRYYDKATPSFRLAPNTPIDARLLIRDPGEIAVGFIIEFAVPSTFLRP